MDTSFLPFVQMPAKPHLSQVFTFIQGASVEHCLWACLVLAKTGDSDSLVCTAAGLHQGWNAGFLQEAKGTGLRNSEGLGWGVAKRGEPAQTQRQVETQGTTGAGHRQGGAVLGLGP